MAFDCQRFSHNFLTFSHFFSLFITFYHFLSFFIILKHFLPLSGYHLYIQNPSKTNPSKSGYQDRRPEFYKFCIQMVCNFYLNHSVQFQILHYTVLNSVLWPSANNQFQARFHRLCQIFPECKYCLCLLM